MSIASTKRATARATQLRAIAKAIETANKNFSKMSAAEKRIAIAKDAIQQIKQGNYTAEQGTYVQLYDPLPEDESKELVEVFQENPTCTVCARGALFVSACRTMNNCTVENVGAMGSDEIIGSMFARYEESFFSRAQIDLIESAFETGCVRANMSDIGITKAIAFGLDYSDSESRMLAILENIVKNKGRFIP